MRVAIHQPEYIGYLGYYSKMLNADAWIILDNVQLSKRDFVSRNRIRGPNGPVWLSVPVLTKGRFSQQILDVEIDNERPWPKKHWKSIQQSYARAPFFETISDHLAPIYKAKWSKLVDLNFALMITISRLLSLERPTYWASDLSVTSKGSQLMADLTLAIDGKTYLSGPTGRDYLEEDDFRERGLGIEYNGFLHPKYPQLHGEFVPNLAAIDLLFNCGTAAGEIVTQSTALPNKRNVKSR